MSEEFGVNHIGQERRIDIDIPGTDIKKEDRLVLSTIKGGEGIFTRRRGDKDLGEVKIAVGKVLEASTQVF